MKKILIAMLALAMIFSLAACGGGNGGGGGGGGGGDASVSDTELKVGFIFIGTRTDGGFSQAHYNGAMALEAHFGGKVEALFMESVNSQNNQAIRDAAVNLIDAGCEVIVGNSFGFMDMLEELAGEYPDIYFLHFSGYKMNDSNFDNFFGAMEEPRYLTGMVAGMMTETNKVGYVAAHPFTEVQIGINAFALGVQAVNPDAEVNVIYINTWGDAMLERQAAEALLDAGCDVIAQHSDSPGPIIAAGERGAFGIAYNLDKPDSSPEAYLTAPVWNHGAYYIKAVQMILDGTFVPFSYYGTMADGFVDIAPLTSLVPSDVVAAVNAAKAKIISGELAPFEGEIFYADGRQLSAEGQRLDRGEIWSINDVIKGVNATSN